MIDTLILEDQKLTRPEIVKKEEPDVKKKKALGFWDKAFRKNKLKNSNKVAVVFLRNNGIAETHELESRNGFFSLHGRTYHERRDCIYTMGKERFPLAIIPEWAVVPIGKKEWYDQPLQEKFSTLQDHVMKGIRHAERVKMGETDSKQLNMKQVIIWGILAIVGVAVLMNYL